MPVVVKVKSSNIRKIGYEQLAQSPSSEPTYVVYVNFGSSWYAYDCVPQSILSGFLLAPSKGKYFITNIKHLPTYKLKSCPF